jgi:hydroxymethylbilane synthase
MTKKIILGTRGSELARAQARMVEEALHDSWPELMIETKIIKTKGDEAGVDIRSGRKGLFTGAIEQALLAHEVDLAVHSAKDLPSETNSSAEIGAVLPRAQTDDVLVSKYSRSLAGLPEGATVATGSVRRKFQLRWKRPDLVIADLRGNVLTRLRKLAQHAWHGIILARAGLERLDLYLDEQRIRFEEMEFSAAILPQEFFLPAGGQGVIAIQVRREDDRSKMLIKPTDDFNARLCLRAEREFLRLLHGDCNQPVGVLAMVDETNLKLRAQVFDPGVSAPREGFVQGPTTEVERLAAQLLDKVNGK